MQSNRTIIGFGNETAMLMTFYGISVGLFYFVYFFAGWRSMLFNLKMAEIRAMDLFASDITLVVASLVLRIDMILLFQSNNVVISFFFLGNIHLNFIIMPMPLPQIAMTNSCGGEPKKK